MNYDDQSSLVEIVFLSVRSTSLDIAFLPSLTCINLQIQTVYNCLIILLLQVSRGQLTVELS